MIQREILVIGSQSTKEVILNAGYSVTNIDKLHKKANKSIFAAIIEVKAEEIGSIGQTLKEIRALVKEFSGQILAFCIGEFDKDAYEHLLEIGFDGILLQSTPEEYIKSRLQSIVRIQNMHEEVILRFESLKAFGGASSMPDFTNKRSKKILVYSEPCPEALICNAILEDLGITVINAPSSFLAFDYLHSTAFDAVIIIAKDNEKSAFSFTNTLRKNSRLFHLPCLIMTGPDYFIRPHDAKYGSTDVARFDRNQEFAIGRLLLAIDEKRRRDALSLAFAAAKTPIAIDNTTGLYTQDFFRHHLLQVYHDSLLESAEMAPKQISVGVLKIGLQNNLDQTLDSQEIRKVRIQIGNMISRLVRVEDTACALPGFRYVVIFTYSNQRAAQIALERIIAVLASSAFDFEDKSKNITIDVEGSAVQLGPDKNAEQVCAELLL